MVDVNVERDLLRSYFDKSQKKGSSTFIFTSLFTILKMKFIAIFALVYSKYGTTNYISASEWNRQEACSSQVWLVMWLGSDRKLNRYKIMKKYQWKCWYSGIDFDDVHPSFDVRGFYFKYYHFRVCHNLFCLSDPTQVIALPARRGWIQVTVVSAPKYLILTVPRRYFCCGSLLLLVLAVRIYTLVHLLCEWHI